MDKIRPPLLSFFLQEERPESWAEVCSVDANLHSFPVEEEGWVDLRDKGAERFGKNRVTQSPVEPKPVEERNEDEGWEVWKTG